MSKPTIQTCIIFSLRALLLCSCAIIIYDMNDDLQPYIDKITKDPKVTNTNTDPSQELEYCNVTSKTSKYYYFGVYTVVYITYCIVWFFFERKMYHARSVMIWSFDLLKIDTAFFIQHIVNIHVSDYMKKYMNKSECELFSMMCLTGGTIGVAILILQVKLCTYLAKKYNIHSISVFGKYSPDGDSKYKFSWIAQQCILIGLFTIIQRAIMISLLHIKLYRDCIGSIIFTLINLANDKVFWESFIAFGIMPCVINLFEIFYLDYNLKNRNYNPNRENHNMFSEGTIIPESFRSYNEDDYFDHDV